MCKVSQSQILNFQSVNYIGNPYIVKYIFVQNIVILIPKEKHELEYKPLA